MWVCILSVAWVSRSNTPRFPGTRGISRQVPEIWDCSDIVDHLLTWNYPSGIIQITSFPLPSPKSLSEYWKSSPLKKFSFSRPFEDVFLKVSKATCHLQWIGVSCLYNEASLRDHANWSRRAFNSFFARSRKLESKSFQLLFFVSWSRTNYAFLFHWACFRGTSPEPPVLHVVTNRGWEGGTDNTETGWANRPPELLIEYYDKKPARGCSHPLPWPCICAQTNWKPRVHDYMRKEQATSKWTVSTQPTPNHPPLVIRGWKWDTEDTDFFLFRGNASKLMAAQCSFRDWCLDGQETESAWLPTTLKSCMGQKQEGCQNSHLKSTPTGHCHRIYVQTTREFLFMEEIHAHFSSHWQPIAKQFILTVSPQTFFAPGIPMDSHHIELFGEM